MKNKIVCLLLALVMVLSCVAILSSCGGDPGPVEDPCKDGHVDADKNGKCDRCGADVKTDPEDDPCKDGHVDANKDGKCDRCGAAVKPNTDDCVHEDMDNDAFCDKCGIDMRRIGRDDDDDPVIDLEEWWTTITYDQTDLIFQMTKCSNSEELSSGCERYLAGEDTSANKDIDTKVSERNEDAEFETKVHVTYAYYDDLTAQYGWSKNIDTIFTATQTKTKNTPDMFCNFMTDMLATSLKGSFANLYSRQRGTNYMDLSDPGYMRDLMASLTLSLEKIYCIASDYFIDLIRAFFCVPVNRNLYDAIAPNMNVKDYDENGETNINDFFGEVEEGKWTYNRLIEYCAEIYRNDSGEAVANLKDRIGYALSSGSGLSSAGAVYTTSVVIIAKEWNSQKADYDYYYPETNPGLVALTEALDKLFSSKGVISVSESQTCGYGSTSLIAIRERFATDNVLFGGIILVGSLEYETYQKMKKTDGTGGFGVVPVPVYKDGDKYLTQIHVVGRCGGIATCTTKFSQCTAFIQYQSEHSTDILNEYYDYNLTYDYSDPSLDGNIDMLKYIRANVRTSFDKLFEDAIGFFYESTDKDATKKRWHSVINGTNLYDHTPYRMDNMAQIYEELYEAKDANLQKLVAEYERLPN